MGDIDIAPTVQAGFELKGLKTWDTHDGGGFQANIYFHGKKVGTVTDHGRGGPVDADWTGIRWDGSIWTPPGLEGRKLATWNRNAKLAQAAKAKMDEIVAATPKVITEWDKDGKGLTVDEGWILSDLSVFAELVKACNRKTCFRRLEDPQNTYSHINQKYDARMKGYIEKTYPGSVILNEEVAAIQGVAA